MSSSKMQLMIQDEEVGNDDAVQDNGKVEDDDDIDINDEDVENDDVQVPKDEDDYVEVEEDDKVQDENVEEDDEVQVEEAQVEEDDEEDKNQWLQYDEKDKNAWLTDAKDEHENMKGHGVFDVTPACDLPKHSKILSALWVLKNETNGRCYSNIRIVLTSMVMAGLWAENKAIQFQLKLCMVLKALDDIFITGSKSNVMNATAAWTTHSTMYKQECVGWKTCPSTTNVPFYLVGSSSRHIPVYTLWNALSMQPLRSSHCSWTQ
jgi:hypothetical protein